MAGYPSWGSASNAYASKYSTHVNLNNFELDLQVIMDEWKHQVGKHPTKVHIFWYSLYLSLLVFLGMRSFNIINQ